ncbi:protein kinase [Nocardia sp. NPDC050712]|uniref:serine/threonine-protein kinase n=1 Tax=Nocardia sp. NPDC050712 TaxID=3155518 RepID=UPI0033E7ADB1
MGAVRFGPYRLERLLGKGGMGEVWLAATGTGHHVALKLLAAEHARDAGYRVRFTREAELATALSDPHIVPIHAHGAIDGRLFIEMAFIDGVDLAGRLAHGPLPVRTAIDIVGQIASALDTAHRIGLVHRDIKPSNILVLPDDFAYLIDFGLARSQGASSVTATGMAIGTLAYMAPERFTGAADARSDVYSLACVLYECLTGTRPFGDTDAAQQMHAHLMAPPPRIALSNPAIPALLDVVIAKGMAKDPADRYAAAGEFAAAASAALDPDSHRGPHPTKVLPTPGLPPTKRETIVRQVPTSSPPRPAHPSPPRGQDRPPARSVPGERVAQANRAPSRVNPIPAASAAPAGGNAAAVAGERVAQRGKPSTKALPAVGPALTRAHLPGGEAEAQSAAGKGRRWYLRRKAVAAPSSRSAGAAQQVRSGPSALVARPTLVGPSPLVGTPALWAPQQPGRLAKPGQSAVRPAPSARSAALRGRGQMWPSRGPGAPVVPPRPVRRRKKKGGVLRKTIGALVVIFLAPFAFAAGCFALITSGNNSGGSGATVANPPAISEPTPEPESRPEPDTAPAGTAVRDGKFEFAVTDVESGVRRVGTQTAAGSFVIVTLTVRNISDEPKWFTPFGQKLVCTDGTELDPHLLATFLQGNGTHRNTIKLEAGETTTGRVVFDVPRSTTPTHLALHDSPFSGGVSVTLG